MLTHANFLGEVDAVFNWVELGPSDALLGVLPCSTSSRRWRTCYSRW